MTELERFCDPLAAERRAAIARHARCLCLAEQNGYPAEFADNGPAGRWWIVPRDFIAIVGCQVALVEEGAAT